ncbi:hypothetical protein VB776_01345 [Arcicella sp. DC2W]|uniref:Tetratricopeptide repeat protein n=1 Tax=Arcicella gelida TaxID=2984195 RepID=A0ABU5RZC5_9BACT|nr:hypothetical protein [Arcicella sp. DC2W]MEA5401540.1 hypothetical protein [Arcicella sp. DC2W]
MKRYFSNSCIHFIILFLSSLLTGFGQSNNISFALVMPEEVDGGLTNTHLQRLHDNLIDVLTQNGIASLNIQNNLVLYPVIKLYNQQTVNAEVQNITVIEADLSLYVKQLDNKLIFSSITKKMKGSGKTYDLALNNMISNAKLDEPNVVGFLDKAKQKAITYYNQRCSSIITQAEQMMKMNRYEEALVSLLSVPSEVDCYQQATTKAVEAFKLYQNQNCNQMLLNAKAKVANRQFEEGLNIIAMIDPSSSCKAEALQLIQQASGQVEADNKRKWDLLNKIFMDSAEIEKRRLDLISQFLISHSMNLPHYYYQNVTR